MYDATSKNTFGSALTAINSAKTRLYYIIDNTYFSSAAVYQTFILNLRQVTKIRHYKEIF